MTAEEQKVEYIRAVISAVEEDKKSVLLYVAFDLTVVSLTLSEKLLARSPASAIYGRFSMFASYQCWILFQPLSKDPSMHFWDCGYAAHT